MPLQVTAYVEMRIMEIESRSQSRRFADVVPLVPGHSLINSKPWLRSAVRSYELDKEHFIQPHMACGTPTSHGFSLRQGESGSWGSTGFAWRTPNSASHRTP